MPRFKPGAFSADTRTTSRRWLAGLIILAVILAGLKTCAVITQRSNPIDQALTRTTGPGAYALKRIGEGILSLGHIFHIPSLLRENNRLSQENAFLQRELERTEGIKRENEALRATRSLAAPAFRSIKAMVIARPYDLWLETAILSAGQVDGVRVGNLVVNGKGVVGKIVEVEAERSRVQLITSPRFRLGAISAASQDEGVIRGSDWKTLVFDYIPAGAKISLGEKVFSLGEQTVTGGEDNRPKGQFIGTVINAKTDKNGFKEILVQPAISPNQLGSVVVFVR